MVDPAYKEFCMIIWFMAYNLGTWFATWLCTWVSSLNEYSSDEPSSDEQIFVVRKDEKTHTSIK